MGERAGRLVTLADADMKMIREGSEGTRGMQLCDLLREFPCRSLQFRVAGLSFREQENADLPRVLCNIAAESFRGVSGNRRTSGIQ